jgi:hypothetical protein
MADPAQLYDKDFYAWTQQQAEALRDAAAAGANLPLDWENLAEEMESLGRSERRELRSRLIRIVRHLLKLEHSPASEPRSGWRQTIREARVEVRTLLTDSPSLKSEVSRLIEEQARDAVELALGDLEQFGGLTPAIIAKIRSTSYTEDEVLGDWFPGREESA